MVAKLHHEQDANKVPASKAPEVARQLQGLEVQQDVLSTLYFHFFDNILARDKSEGEELH
jgi:hypothetical protein